MAISPESIAPPSDDKRWRVVTTTMRRHGFVPSALIETLSLLYKKQRGVVRFSVGVVCHGCGNVIKVIVYCMTCGTVNSLNTAI